VRRCLAVVALGVAVWGVASWGVAPMLRTSHGGHATHGKQAAAATVSNSPIGGLVPGLAQPSDSSYRQLRIGILDGSGASRSHAALDELARLELRRGPVRPVGKVRTHDLLVYARGAGKQGRVVASMLGVKARARGAWRGPQLPPTTLVYVLGAG
jgi:hypothetical protein